jgi:serine/threonine protein kinase
VLGEELGTGATAVVFRRIDTGTSSIKLGSVVNVSRYGFKADIEHELMILKKLAAGHTQPNGSSSPHIPKVVDENSITKDGQLEIELGCVLKNLPAIETSPVGMNAMSYVLNGSAVSDEAKLRTILHGIKYALDYMHKKEIFHCDVTPRNIIVATDGENRDRAVLIDYSLATQTSKLSKSFKGFRGTPNYVHREIYQFCLSGKKWKPTQNHDKAGLGFSLAFFANHCVRPWNVVGYPKRASPRNNMMHESLEAAMKSRSKKAIKAVSRLGDELKREIVDFLKLDQSANE